MRVALVGDGLLASLILFFLRKREFDGEVVWFRGRTPTIPPVSLLHRHVGRSFETDVDRDTTWTYAKEFVEKELLERAIARRLTMLRPAALESRLNRSFESMALGHVTRHDVEEFPFLSASDTVFRYDDAFTIDSRGLLSYICDSLSGMSVQEQLPLARLRRGVKRGEGGFVAQDVIGKSLEVTDVVFAAGAATSYWVSGLQLERYPGELVIAGRPKEFPPEYAVSRHGHVVPSVCGERVCVGATYLHPVGDLFPVVDRRRAWCAIDECLTGIKKSVPALDLIRDPKVWYGTRAVVHPDRRPIVGPINDEHLFIATGLASKGMLWGPLVAHSLVNLLLDRTPIPLRSIRSERIPSLAFRSHASTY